MTDSRNRPLRVGVAGLGFGADVHIPALLSLPGVDLVGIAGSSTERAALVAARLGIANACGSVEELLGLGLDAVTLALPPNQVAAAVRAALDCGVAILCEKPLGTDAAEAAELAYLAAGHVTAMDFQFAELETFVRLKQIIDSGVLGQPRHAQVVWLTESWAHRNRAWSWKTDAARGGGAIALFGSHLFFLAEWLLGPAISVWARIDASATAAFAPAGTRSAEDLVHCRMEHRNGAVFAATFGNANPGSTVHRWTVVFEGGTVTIENATSDYMANFSLVVSGGCLDGEQISEPKADGDGRLQPFRRLAARFVNGVCTNRPVYPDLAVGARAMTIDAAVRASATRGVELSIPFQDLTHLDHSSS